MQLEADPVENDPEGQFKHTLEPIDCAYCPGGHAVHTVVLAENEPAPHEVHLVPPEFGAMVPLAQTVQEDCPDAACTAPAGQIVHVTLLLPSAYEPALQAVCADAPAFATINPGAALMQEAIPLDGVYVPAGQVPQPGWPVLSWY